MRTKLSFLLLSFMSFSVLVTSLNAQQRWTPERYGLGKGDIAFNATGQFSYVIDQSGPSHVNTLDSVGALVTIHAHPKPWLGAEINGGYTNFGQVYNYISTQGGVSTPTSFRMRTNEIELTAGYLFKVPTPWVKPFMAIGGGAIDFHPVDTSPGQWRATGMYSFGFDISAKNHPHSGFRIQQHGLLYRTPTYERAELASGGWTHQLSPAFGVFARW